MTRRNRILIIIAALIPLLAVIIFAIWWQMTQDSQPSTDTSPTSETSTPAPTEEVPSDGEEGVAGQYVEYSEEAVNTTDGRRVLFFHADWCPQCRALEADIKANDLPADMTIFEVDYDTETELKQRYGVTLQTTVVEVDENGNEVAKTVPYDEPTLEFVLNEIGR